MSETLYSLDILRLAAATVDHPRLADAHASVERRSTTCGSRMTADVRLDGEGRVEAYGHDVRACALGQAAAVVVARWVTGRGASELAEASDGVAQFFAGELDRLPDVTGIDVLARARPYPARHGAVRLAFEAAAQAAGQATDAKA